jgi:glycosyltransferase A (GT-A) superfamily protein (DUF2064 family)
MHQHYIVLVSKYPVLGYTKTRLMATLGPQMAFDISRALFEDTLESISKLVCILLHCVYCWSNSLPGFINDQAIAIFYPTINNE